MKYKVLGIIFIVAVAAAVVSEIYYWQVYIQTQNPVSMPAHQATGILTGHVTVGPICPVERQGVPCPVPSEAYTSRQVGVYTIATATTPEGFTNAKLVASQHLDSQGNYQFDLPPGKYDIRASGMQVDQLSADEGTVTIKVGETTTLNFTIDTGIR